MSSPEPTGAEEDKPLALQSKEKYGRNCNLGATGMPAKSLGRTTDAGSRSER
jgi:hypothetical protein